MTKVKLTNERKYDVDKFTYDKKWKTFVSKYSTLDLMLYAFNENGEIERGIKLYSNRTKNVTHWKLVKINRNNNDSISSWIFIPTSDTINKFKSIEGFVVKIINDIF